MRRGAGLTCRIRRELPQNHKYSYLLHIMLPTPKT
ncbi:hypothetical protein Enr8_23420 [Blastopirellula retiformator]|uniref:Uncharacterized protein n=1 Tax=Blastopirellula retiformator TaxID=2527970 RepID=A0A5C5V8L8_9BACT|nr:hypothetical protein Enr8_23420 [Blastopirellula retiformator]